MKILLDSKRTKLFETNWQEEVLRCDRLAGLSRGEASRILGLSRRTLHCKIRHESVKHDKPFQSAFVP